MKRSFYLFEGRQAAKALRKRGGELSKEVQNELIKKRKKEKPLNPLWSDTAIG